MDPLTDAERAQPYYPEDDQVLLCFRLSHASAVERLGIAHRQMDAEDNEPGPCEYWSFRFSCGLRVFIVYRFDGPIGPGGDVLATSPDIDHILTHIPLTDCVFWRLDHAQPEFYRQRYGNTGHCPVTTSWIPASKNVLGSDG